MKSKLLTIFLVFLLLQTKSQEALLHTISQKQQTTKHVSEWFSVIGIESDYVYVVIIPLGSCPRCEGAIIQFVNHISTLDADNELIIIAIYPNERAARAFLKSKNYGTDAIQILSPDADFIDGFWFSTRVPQVPFITKFNTGKGELLKSVSLLGLDYTEKVAQQFYSTMDIEPSHALQKKDVKLHDFDNNFLPKLAIDLKQFKEDGLETFLVNGFIEFEIDEAQVVISEAGNISISKDHTYVTVDDHLSSSSFFYELTDSVYLLKSKNPLGAAYLGRFIDDDVPDYLVKYMEKANILHSMLLKSIIYNDKIYYSFSLPHLFWEDKENESLGYMNKAVIVSKRLTVPTADTVASFTPFDIQNNDVAGFSHSDFFVIGDSLYLPVKKGWPITGTTDFPAEEKDNPFSKEFYKQTAAFNVFALDGKFVGTYGELPDWHVYNKTGYTFFNPIIKKSETGSLFMADKNNCVIYELAIDDGKPIRSISLLNNHDMTRPVATIPDLPGLDYFQHISSHFRTKIIDFAVVNEAVYAIISNEDALYLVKTDFEEPENSTYKIIPNKINEGKVVPKIIDINDNGEIVIVSLIRYPDRTSIAFSSLP